MRRLLPLFAAALPSACQTPRVPEHLYRLPDPPPLQTEEFDRDRPVFHLQDVDAGKDYYVYSFPEGRLVMTVEAGAGRRYATEEETQAVLARYEAVQELSPEDQDGLYLRQRREEKAEGRPFDDAELLARMDRTIARWQEERRALEIQGEAARTAGLKDEEAKVRPLVAELDRLILAHELKKKIYTSPEWKAGRTPPPPDRTLRPADVSK